MNVLDFGILVLLVLATIIGVGSGALPQLGGLVGAIAGAGLGIAGLPLLREPLKGIPVDVRAILVLGGILFLVGLGEAIGSALGRSLTVRVRGGVLGTADRLLGGFVGAAQALLVVWLLGGLLAAGPTRFLATQAQTSLVVRAMSVVLPSPTEFATQIALLLDDTGIPDLFIGLEPLPAPDVDRPSDPAANAIAAAARASVARVSAATCLYQSSGTGFAIAPDYVLTNAHVVAGGTTIRVQIPGGRILDAIPVAFDSSLDIAVLYVQGLDAVPLRFAATEPARGAIGATLGFPHGGGLDIEPAAVAGAYSAQGRDIYGTSRVTRRILELRAVVDQGDSGGPLILTDGTVGGVVFAEARTDENAGYALSPTAVATAAAPAIGRVGAVQPGTCIH